MKINSFLLIGCALIHGSNAASTDDMTLVPREFLSGARVTKPIVAELLDSTLTNARIKPETPLTAREWMRTYIRANKRNKTRMRHTLATHACALVKAAEMEDALPYGGLRSAPPVAGTRPHKAMRRRAKSIGCVAECDDEPTQLTLETGFIARGYLRKEARRNARVFFHNLKRCRTDEQRKVTLDEIHSLIETTGDAATAEEALVCLALPKTCKKENRAAGRTRDGRGGATHRGALSTGRHQEKSRRR